MHPATYSMNVSLDGYVEGPDGGIDWSVPDDEIARLRSEPGDGYIAIGGCATAYAADLLELAHAHEHNGAGINNERRKSVR